MWPAWRVAGGSTVHLGTPSKQVVFDVARYISVRVVSGGKDLGFGVGAVHGHREHEPDGVEQ